MQKLTIMIGDVSIEPLPDGGERYNTQVWSTETGDPADAERIGYLVKAPQSPRELLDDLAQRLPESGYDPLAWSDEWFTSLWITPNHESPEVALSELLADQTNAPEAEGCTLVGMSSPLWEIAANGTATGARTQRPGRHHAVAFAFDASINSSGAHPKLGAVYRKVVLSQVDWKLRRPEDRRGYARALYVSGLSRFYAKTGRILDNGHSLPNEGMLRALADTHIHP